jgi:hypothetical protein
VRVVFASIGRQGRTRPWSVADESAFGVYFSARGFDARLGVCALQSVLISSFVCVAFSFLSFHVIIIIIIILILFLLYGCGHLRVFRSPQLISDCGLQSACCTVERWPRGEVGGDGALCRAREVVSFSISGTTAFGNLKRTCAVSFSVTVTVSCSCTNKADCRSNRGLLQ